MIPELADLGICPLDSPKGMCNRTWVPDVKYRGAFGARLCLTHNGSNKVMTQGFNRDRFAFWHLRMNGDPRVNNRETKDRGRTDALHPPPSAGTYFTTRSHPEVQGLEVAVFLCVTYCIWEFA